MRISKVLCGLKKITAIIPKKEKEIIVAAPWGKLAGLSWGDPSNPPVFICPGRGDVCSTYRPLVSLLPDNFFYVTVDMPGNGRSDHFPKGLRITVSDLVPSIAMCREHFKWDKFAFIGHSLAVNMGRIYSWANPGVITRFVDLDPVILYDGWGDEDIGSFYNYYYTNYYNYNYGKFNMEIDTGPKYSYETILKKMMEARYLTKETAELVLERCLDPAGDGLYRVNFDQRMKTVPVLPLSATTLRRLNTSMTEPILSVLAGRTLNFYEFYKKLAFLTDVAAWPNGNYRFVVLQSTHDIHLQCTDLLAVEISKFLGD